MPDEYNAVDLNVQLYSYWKLRKRLFLASGIWYASNFTDKYAFLSQTGLGYLQFVRGYEYYAVNGSEALLFKSLVKFELLPIFNPEFRYILPFRVTGLNHSFTLFAIWAMNSKENYDARYIGQIWLAINHYRDLLNTPTILIGDFNSNKIWDNKARVGDHSAVVNKLLESNIQSIYHRHFKIDQGKEKHPTFFLQRNFDKPFHIDYCFASADILDKVQNIEIGTYENWSTCSDHTPLIIDFDL